MFIIESCLEYDCKFIANNYSMHTVFYCGWRIFYFVTKETNTIFSCCHCSALQQSQIEQNPTKNRGVPCSLICIAYGCIVLLTSKANADKLGLVFFFPA